MVYAWEKLSAALDSLVRSGPIQDRLESAAVAMVMLKPDDFFEDERPLFSIIVERLHTHEDPKSGALAASARKKSDEMAEKVACDIVSLFSGHMMALVYRAEEQNESE